MMREPFNPFGKEQQDAMTRIRIIPFIFAVLAILAVIVFVFCKTCRAEEINVEKLATAIYYAEGGEKTSHPYGILAHYKHTTPRQACKNTINHALKDFDGKGDFLRFLANRYAPLNCANDPHNLNANWHANVRRLYAKI